MKNTDTHAIVRLGDLGNGFYQDENGLIRVLAEPDMSYAYVANEADAFAGSLQLTDTSSGNVLVTIPVTNLFDTQGEYLGSVLKFDVAKLAA